MIVVELKGGLGNQMFQYALGKQLAIKNNCELFLDCHFLLDRRLKNPHYVYRDFDLDIFNLTPQFIPKEISKKYGLLRSRLIRLKEIFYQQGDLTRIQEKVNIFNPKILDLQKNTYLTGYWQTEKYFINIAKEIRSEFSFRKKINIKSLNLLDKINRDNSVCLNVRRTDYVYTPRLGTLNNSYYAKAEQVLLEKESGLKVYVFSDDLKWCKEHIRLQSETFFVGHEYAGAKFRDYFELMMNCKHFIIPNSSFAWWAAWLSKSPNKNIITPKVWFNSTSTVYQADTVVPDTWIRV